jgi:hypothetical protein
MTRTTSRIKTIKVRPLVSLGLLYSFLSDCYQEALFPALKNIIPYSAVVIHYLKNRQVRSADDDRPVVETIETLLEQVEGLLGQVHPELLDQARHELQLGQGQGELAGDQPESAREESVETYRSSHIRRRRSGLLGGQVRKNSFLERGLVG